MIFQSTELSQHMSEFPATRIHLRGLVRQAQHDIADAVRLQQRSKSVVDSPPDLHAVGPRLMVETDGQYLRCCL